MKSKELNGISAQPVRIKRRRQFTGEYKLHVLCKTDAMKTSRQIREFLNQETLLPSTLNRWRKERTKHLANGIPSKKRGQKQTAQNTLLSNRAISLEKQIKRLKKQLQGTAATICEQKKRIRTSIQMDPPLISSDTIA
ncbi:MAG: hypothetical protein V1793_09325 [Pseudomonadota bacterium]